MNTNAARIPVTADLVALAPTKVQRFLTKALDRGLTVWQHTNTTATNGTGWTIESPAAIDDWQLWLYFQPGSRTGSLTITRYTPHTTRKSVTAKLTQHMAGIAIDNMGDTLDRALLRDAMTRLADDVAAENAAKADAPSDGAPQRVLKALRANGRFALRTARHGAIPRNTVGKVRAALMGRALIEPTGALTELGRAVRSLLVTH